MDESEREAVGRDIGQPIHAIGPEVVILPLFAVRAHRRPRRLKSLDRVADRFVEQRVESRVRAPGCFYGLDQGDRSGDASDRFRGNYHDWGVGTDGEALVTSRQAAPPETFFRAS